MKAKEQLITMVGEEMATKWIQMVQEGIAPEVTEEQPV